MAKIQVDIISRSRASCTDEFVTNDTINAEELQHLLERRFGEGALWDSQRRPVISHPARIIEAGDYQYTISLNGMDTERPTALTDGKARLWSC